MPERELLVALDEQVRLEELLDRRQQVRAGRPSVRASSSKLNVRPSEAATVTASLASSDSRPSRSRIFCLYAARQPGVDQLGMAVDHADPPLLSQSEERLDNEERTPAGLHQLLDDRLVWVRAEQVSGHPRDRIVIQWRRV